MSCGSVSLLYCIILIKFESQTFFLLLQAQNIAAEMPPRRRVIATEAPAANHPDPSNTQSARNERDSTSAAPPANVTESDQHHRQRRQSTQESKSKDHQQSVFDAKSAALKKQLKEKKKLFVKLGKSWTQPKKVIPETIMTPEEFSSYWGKQSCLYLLNSLSCLELNLTGAGFLPPFNATSVLSVFFFDKVFVQILSWTNAYIRIEKLEHSEVQLYEMYQWW